MVSPKRMDRTGNYLASDNDLVVWPEGADGQATDHSNIRNTPVVQDKRLRLRLEPSSINYIR